jgi:putative AlgH/UPF0301 family transcriptional regulator
MNRPGALSAMRRRGLIALFALLFAWPPLAGAGPLYDSLVLVAKPQLNHPLYARTVLVVTAFGASQHLGFIVNRPGPFTLGRMFPGHAPSQKIVGPVFFGGPVELRVTRALRTP